MFRNALMPNIKRQPRLSPGNPSYELSTDDLSPAAWRGDGRLDVTPERSSVSAVQEAKPNIREIFILPFSQSGARGGFKKLVTLCFVRGSARREELDAVLISKSRQG